MILVHFDVWIDRPTNDCYYGQVQAESAEAAIQWVRKQFKFRVFPILLEIGPLE